MLYVILFAFPTNFIIYIYLCDYYNFNKYLPGLGNRSFALSLFALSLFSKRAPRSDSLFRSFQKERKRAIRPFALFKKSAKERIALSLFFSLFLARKRAIRSFRKRAIAQTWVLANSGEYYLCTQIQYTYST